MSSIGNVSDLPFIYSPDHDDEPAITVVESVAWASGRRADELEPLQDVIDIDTLNTLFGGTAARSGAEPRDLELCFRYDGCQVTVEPGQVWVDPN